jgi:hypothetical protein
MPSEYNIYVYNPSGELQALITDYTDFAIGRVVNGYDTLDINIPYTSPSQPYMQMDYFIEIYRSNSQFGIPSYLEFSGLIHKTTFNYDRLKNWRVVAFGWESLLARRLVAYNEDNPNKSNWNNKSASTIMYDMVNLNIGAGSTTVGITDRAVSGIVSGFTFDADTLVGNILHVADKSYENLLTALQDVALQGDVDFEVVWNGGTSWTFRVGYPLLATDRSAFVQFSVDNGTIGSFTSVNDRTVYGTTAIVRGQGTSNATVRRVRPATPLTELNSREFFVEASALGNNTTDLDNFGDARLLGYTKKALSITTTIQQTPSNLYGLDYFIGDLVTVDIISSTQVLQVNQVTISVDSSGNENIKVQLEYDN